LIPIVRALVFLSLLALLLTVSASCAASSEVDPSTTEVRPVVLVLVDKLTWEEVQGTPSLEKSFGGRAVANLSTAQGAVSADSRMGYVLLGAGSRVDTSLLPKNLPQETTELPEAFRGPASPIRPGLLGETLAGKGVTTAAVGERAELVVMDRKGRVASAYEATRPVENLEEALADDAEFIAVEANNPADAGRISDAAQEAGAVVAVTSLNAPSGSANLTPFIMENLYRPYLEGLLYSPTTRTRGLITSSDVAPTLLAQLGIDPPSEMQGRAAVVRPGSVDAAARLGERLSFVAEKRPAVWLLIGCAMIAGASLAILWRRKTGAVYALLVLAALPAGALAVAALPITNVPGVAFLTLLLAGTLAGLFWGPASSVAFRVCGVYLAVSALILADTAFGGPLMKLSTLGYNPAYGTRFYGIGNEYAAFLAGSLTMGVGALAHRRRLPLALVLLVGLAAIVVLGLPTMGADVGGSLALGLGFGATVGLLRGAGLRSLALWMAGGLAPAAALFLTSGLLFPGVSHGSRAAGGETGLADVVARKLLLSLDLLLNPAFLPILAAGLVVVFLAWRRMRGTALGAGLLGATITALASGALNDSGVLAAIYALAYPTIAAGIFLLSKAGKVVRSHQTRI
jgi:hypothetical protein